MATTEIVQFGSGGSGTPNVLNQADYNTFLSGLSGNSFADGAIPSAKQINKIIRQPSFIAAGLASWMVAQGVTVADDGNLSALVSEITSAIDAHMASYLSTNGLLIPTGTIIANAGNSTPTGFLLCPAVATAISRTTYAALFAAIGTLWGAGDGSTTFGMPFFPNDYAIINSGSGTVGTNSTGSIKAHTHTFGIPDGTTGSGDAVATIWTNTGDHAYTTDSTGGSENFAAGTRLKFFVKI
jgi:hypothetical protein